MRKILCLMLVLLGTVMLSAKNVSVTVFPETATVMQKGKVIQPVTPGVYSLTVSIVDLVFVAQADGYDSQQFIINLKSPSTMQVRLSLIASKYQSLANLVQLQFMLMVEKWEKVL